MTAKDVIYGPIHKDGQVALVVGYGTEQRIRVGEKEYYFQNRGGVTLSWVDDADEGAVLSVKKVCCGGKTSPMFRYANSAQIAHWEGLG